MLSNVLLSGRSRLLHHYGLGIQRRLQVEMLLQQRYEFLHGSDDEAWLHLALQLLVLLVLPLLIQQHCPSAGAIAAHHLQTWTTSRWRGVQHGGHLLHRSLHEDMLEHGLLTSSRALSPTNIASLGWMPHVLHTCSRLSGYGLYLSGGSNAVPHSRPSAGSNAAQKQHFCLGIKPTVDTSATLLDTMLLHSRWCRLLCDLSGCAAAPSGAHAASLQMS